MGWLLYASSAGGIVADFGCRFCDSRLCTLAGFVGLICMDCWICWFWCWDCTCWVWVCCSTFLGAVTLGGDIVLWLGGWCAFGLWVRLFGLVFPALFLGYWLAGLLGWLILWG